MQKLVLMSIIIISVIAPAVAARQLNPRLGLRKTLTWCLIGMVFYVLALLLIYPRFNP